MLKKALSVVLCMAVLICTVSSSLAIKATESQKAVIQQITTTFENSSTSFVYNYAENIGDGRGITFGCIGFTTGTYDGNILLKRYKKLNPNNTLAKYIPALDRIDKLPHDEDGKCSDVTGLSNFIKDVEKCSDPLFKQAQLELCDEMYWNPAVNIANNLGAKYIITLGQIYDSCIQQGPEGCMSLVKKTNSAVGTIKSGVSEKKWLTKFLELRNKLLKEWGSTGWNRVSVYQKLLKDGKTSLKPSFKITIYKENFTITGKDLY